MQKHVYIHRLSMPTKLSIRVCFVLLYFPTPARSFDLEQTSLSFSTLAPLFLMFARCLVHGSVAPTFRRGAGSLEFEGPWACDAVSQVSSTGRRTKKKGAKRGRGGGETEGREEIWGYRRVAGKKFPDEFSRRLNLGRRILTPVLRR